MSKSQDARLLTGDNNKIAKSLETDLIRFFYNETREEEKRLSTDCLGYLVEIPTDKLRDEFRKHKEGNCLQRILDHSKFFHQVCLFLLYFLFLF